MARGGSTELASAYLSLIPSLRGASAKIENDLRNMNLTRAGGYMGDSLSTGLLGKLKTAAALGVKTIGAMGGAVAGLTVYGGISRALKIEQATSNFKSMGISVEEALASCNEAVIGTAYGLDSAAQVAASLAASGVQLGDDMTSSLKAVAGMASLSGRSMEDVGLIFGKVAAQGKLQGDELMQFAENGINATAALANYLGVTQQEARELVSQGVVDFQTFSDAMYATFGEAAQDANETFTGAMSNVQAALSRLGAKFATPALENIRKVFVALIPAINTISTLMDPLVEKFTNFTSQVSMRAVAGIEAFTEALTNTGSIVSAFKWLLDAAFEGTVIGTLVGKINGFTGAVKAGTSPVALLKAYVEELGDYVSEVLAPAIETFGSAMENMAVKAGAFAGVFAAAFAVLSGPVARIAAGLAAIAPWILKVKDLFIVFGAYVAQCGGGLLGVSRVLAAIAGPVGIAVSVISALVAGFVALFTTNQSFRDTITGLVQQIGQSLAPALLLVQQTVTSLAAVLMPIVTSIINALLPVIGQIVVVILQVVAALTPLVTSILAVLLPILATLIQQISQTAAIILIAIVPVVSQVLALIQAVMPIVVSLVTSGMNAILAVVQVVWPLVQTIIESAMVLIQDIIAIVTAAIQGDWESVWNGIKQFFSDLWTQVGVILSAALDTASALLDSALAWIQSIWSSCWDSVSTFLSQKWDEIVASVSAKGEEVVSFFESLPGNILSALGSLGTLLYDAGCQIMGGLLDGIEEKVQGVYDFVSGIGATIASLKGPKEYDLKLLVPNGGWIMQSLSAGLEKGMPGLRATLGRITEGISGAIQPDFSQLGSNQTALAMAGGYTPYRGESESNSPVYNITLNADIKDFEGIQTLNDLYDMLARARAINPTRR